MAKRKEFKTIADGLVNSFISRNNDVHGYWGIGKLYSHMTSTESNELKIDLIQRTIEPPNKEFTVLINEFANRLISQIKKRQLNLEFLKKAELTMVIIPDEAPLCFGKMAPNTINCSLALLDDLDREHVGKATTWCRAHNPEKEWKSTRAY